MYTVTSRNRKNETTDCSTRVRREENPGNTESAIESSTVHALVMKRVY